MAILQVTAKYNNPCLSGNDMILEVFSDALLTTANLRFVITITFPSLTGIKPITLYADPSADPIFNFNSYAQFNLSHAVTSALKGQEGLYTDFPDSTTSNSYLVAFPNRLASSIIVAATEYSGTPPTFVNTLTLSSNKVLLGGTDYASLYTPNWFNTYFNTNKNFLTWMPNDKKTYSDQAEFLLFMAPYSGTHTYQVGVVATKKDGSTVTFNNVFGNNTNIAQYTVIRYNVGYAAIKSFQPTFPAVEDLDFYNVVVTRSTGTPAASSEVRWFYMDLDYQPYRKKLVWLNSLSGWDSFSFTGKSEIQSEVSDIKVNLYHFYDYLLLKQLQRGQRKSTEREEQTSISINTGYQKKATVDAMKDLLLSEFVYEDINGKLVPVEVDPETFKIAEDGQDNWSLSLAFRYLFKNKFYTPREKLF